MIVKKFKYFAKIFNVDFKKNYQHNGGRNILIISHGDVEEECYYYPDQVTDDLSIQGIVIPSGWKALVYYGKRYIICETKIFNKIMKYRITYISMKGYLKKESFFCHSFNHAYSCIFNKIVKRHTFINFYSSYIQEGIKSNYEENLEYYMFDSMILRWIKQIGRYDYVDIFSNYTEIDPSYTLSLEIE